jgi:hypothetical protein
MNPLIKNEEKKLWQKTKTSITTCLPGNKTVKGNIKLFYQQ